MITDDSKGRAFSIYLLINKD